MQYTNGTSGGQCGTDVGDSRRGDKKKVEAYETSSNLKEYSKRCGLTQYWTSSGE